ncbi:MAG: methionyl-tRNA formyltransferase [Planctomycetota bacterium]|jgi:methionyl-tRNA formyltransferase
MRLIFAGSGEFAVPALRSLAGGGHEVALVLTQPDRAAGRGRKMTPTPVRQMADELGVETIATEQVNAPEMRERVATSGASLAVTVAFGQKIGPELLQTPPAGWINLHASLLPAYRGASPIHRAVLDRCERTGVTVFRLTERMDAGPILTTRWTAIKPAETTAELHDRLAAIGCDALQAALALFEDGVPDGTPQDESQATKAPRLRKDDGRIDFSRPAAVEAAHICGMWSWPGATCRYVSAATGKSENVTLARARVAEVPPGSLAAGPPGQLDDRLYVTAGSGFVELLEIKPQAGRVMPWPDFVNGRHVQPGDRFSGGPAPTGA